MREENNKTDKETFPSEIRHILEQELHKVVNSISNQSILHEIELCVKYREEKGLIYSTSLTGREYLEGQWKYFYEEKVNNHHQSEQKAKEEKPLEDNKNQELPEEKQEEERVYLPQLSLHELILQAATKREHLIQDEIFNETLKINKRIKPNINLLNNNNLLQEKKEILIEDNKKQLNESNTSRNSEKDFFEFIKNEKQEKERRKKLLEKQLEKELEQEKQKKLEEEKLKEQENLKKLEEKRNKEKELLNKREKEKELIKKHHSLYSEFQTKLFHLKEKEQETMNLLNRFSTDEIRRIESEKKQVYKSFEKPKIDEHEKSYLESVSQRNQERYKKFEEMRKIEEIEKEKSRIRYHSGYKFERPEDEYERKRREEYERAKEKRDRIMEYRNRVKSNYLPEVDEEKKTELLRLVEELESSRKVKRKMLKNGEKVVEKLEVKDHKEVGLGYLESVKKQVEKMREFKKEMEEFREDMTQMSGEEESFNNNNKNFNNNNGKKKHIDYLKQLRESNNIKPTSTAFSTPRNTVFSTTKRSELSFDEKMKKIETLSHKLMEKTKQEEMLLKYGKFKTPEEILNKKELIDKNYLELVNMKLKMIEDELN